MRARWRLPLAVLLSSSFAFVPARFIARDHRGAPLQRNADRRDQKQQERETEQRRELRTPSHPASTSTFRPSGPLRSQTIIAMSILRPVSAPAISPDARNCGSVA